MSNALIPVSFHGDSLFIIDHDGEPFTPMKPIVESMGLAWAGQHQKLTANKQRWGIMIFMIPSANGEQEMLCMPVRKLPAYLGNIYPNKVRPELRGKIILYQNECDDVLWKYWTGQQVKRERPAIDAGSRLSKRSDPERKALASIKSVWVSMAPFGYKDASAMVNAHFGVSGVDEMTVDQCRAATAWIQEKIDLLQNSQHLALPPAQSEADELECRFAAIKGHVCSIAEIEREICRIAKEGMRPALLSVNTPRRSIAIQAHAAMEKLFRSLDYGLEAAEATVRSALIASRV